MSRADARDTGAALLIRGDGALGVETPAHKEGQEEGGDKKGGLERSRRKGEAARRARESAKRRTAKVTG